MHCFAKPAYLFIVYFSFFTSVSWHLTLNFIFHYIIAHWLQNSFFIIIEITYLFPQWIILLGMVNTNLNCNFEIAYKYKRNISLLKANLISIVSSL